MASNNNNHNNNNNNNNNNNSSSNRDVLRDDASPENSGLLHHRLFYVQWKRSQQQQQQDRDEGDGRNSNINGDNNDTTVMIFDSAFHWNASSTTDNDNNTGNAEEEEEVNMFGDAGDVPLSSEQRTLALERTMEAQSRSYLDRVVGDAHTATAAAAAAAPNNNNTNTAGQDEQRQRHENDIGLPMRRRVRVHHQMVPPVQMVRIVNANHPPPPPRRNMPQPQPQPQEERGGIGAAIASALRRVMGRGQQRQEGAGDDGTTAVNIQQEQEQGQRRPHNDDNNDNSERNNNSNNNNNRQEQEQQQEEQERPRQRRRLNNQNNQNNNNNDNNAEQPGQQHAMVQMRIGLVRGPDGQPQLVPFAGQQPQQQQHNNNNDNNNNIANNDNNNDNNNFVGLNVNDIEQYMNQAVQAAMAMAVAAPLRANNERAEQEGREGGDGEPNNIHNNNNNNHDLPNNNQNIQNNNNNINNNRHQEPPPPGIGAAIAQVMRRVLFHGRNDNGENNENNENGNRNHNRANQAGEDAVPNGNNRNENGQQNQANNNNNNNNNAPPVFRQMAFQGQLGEARFGFGAIPIPMMMMRMDPNAAAPHHFDPRNNQGGKPRWNLAKLKYKLQRHENNNTSNHKDVSTPPPTPLSPPPTTTSLCIDALEGIWNVLSDQDWHCVCETLVQTLPNVTTLQLHHAEHLDDVKRKELLEHFSRITKLQIKQVGGTMTETFRWIGTMHNLSHLCIKEDGSARSTSAGLSPECCKVLAESLFKLPKLSSLTLENLILQDVSPCWTPILKSIRSIPTIADLSINGGWHQYSLLDGNNNNNNAMNGNFFGANNMAGPTICQRIQLSATNMEKLQYGPRICEAKDKYLNKQKRKMECNDDNNKSEANEPILRDWVDAIISVRNRIDCIHYFMTQMDPNMFAIPAMEAAKAKENEKEEDTRME